MPAKKSAILISIGAEATLEKKEMFGKEVLVKTRVPKGYRNPALDAKLRKERTLREARMLHSVKKMGIISPVLYLVDSHSASIYMEYVDAPRLKHVLLNSKIKTSEKMRLCREFGQLIARLHAQHTIHGDLTTSNVLVRKKETKNELVLIDFGLSTNSHKIEDAAVDLVNLKKTFSATHSTLEKGWDEVQKGYLENGGKKDILTHVDKVESRIRYA